MQPVGLVARSNVKVVIAVALATTAVGGMCVRTQPSIRAVSTPPLTRPPAKTPTTPPAPAVAPRVDPWDAALLDFESYDFSRVYHARAMFLADPDRAVPALLAMLDRRDAAPLYNTADLIYPCTTEWYGHGWGEPYELEWIADRAGWVLEYLTFEDFGFTAVSPWGCNKTPRAHTGMASARARAWAAAHTTFRYHDALLGALADPARRNLPLSLIRNSYGSPLPRITCDDYAVRITPRLTKIAKSHGNGARVAREILEDPPWAAKCAATR